MFQSNIQALIAFNYFIIIGAGLIVGGREMLGKLFPSLRLGLRVPPRSLWIAIYRLYSAYIIITSLFMLRLMLHSIYLSGGNVLTWTAEPRVILATQAPWVTVSAVIVASIIYEISSSRRKMKQDAAKIGEKIKKVVADV